MMGGRSNLWLFWEQSREQCACVRVAEAGSRGSMEVVVVYGRMANGASPVTGVV